MLTGAPSAVTDGGAGFSGSVNPEGLPTTAYFQYGLDRRYSQVGASGPNYTAQTQPQTVGSDFTSHGVGPVTVAGLVPNALYHVRLVATNTAGTTFGQDITFTTAMAPAPGAPTLGSHVQHPARVGAGAGRHQRAPRAADRADPDPVGRRRSTPSTARWS